MKLTKIFVLFTIIAAFFSSCSTSDQVVTGNLIQKRKYNKGFYVDLKKKSNVSEVASVDKVSTTQERDVDMADVTIKPQSYASSSGEVSSDDLLVVSTEGAFVPLPQKVESAEIMSLGDKKNTETIVLERAAKKELVKTIKQQKKLAKKADAKDGKSAMDGGKSQLVALLLCFFVGFLSIHRFYLGYPGLAILQIITLGGLGIWWLIDFIRIITGDLKPKDGEYEKTL